jgi:hypothetical protein
MVSGAIWVRDQLAAAGWRVQIAHARSDARDRRAFLLAQLDVSAAVAAANQGERQDQADRGDQRGAEERRLKALDEGVREGAGVAAGRGQDVSSLSSMPETAAIVVVTNAKPSPTAPR